MAKKIEKCDGLGPHEVKKIRNALRQVWHRSYARKLVVDRCTDKEGFAFCEKCDKRTPKLKVDHIIACGDVDNGYIDRLFTSSAGLQGLCKECHNAKTKLERQKLKGKPLKRKSKKYILSNAIELQLLGR